MPIVLFFVVLAYLLFSGFSSSASELSDPVYSGLAGSVGVNDQTRSTLYLGGRAVTVDASGVPVSADDRAYLASVASRGGFSGVSDQVLMALGKKEIDPVFQAIEYYLNTFSGDDLRNYVWGLADLLPLEYWQRTFVLLRSTGKDYALVKGPDIKSFNQLSKDGDVFKALYETTKKKNDAKK